jgi:hypothetical protein
MGKQLKLELEQEGQVFTDEAIEVAKRMPTTILSPQKRMCAIPNVVVKFNNLITSCHSLHSNVLLDSKSLADEQVVVAAGPTSEFQVGDFVRINVDMFPKTSKPGNHDVGTVYTIIPPKIKIGNTDYLYMSDRHIMFKYKK